MTTANHSPAPHHRWRQRVRRLTAGAVGAAVLATGGVIALLVAEPDAAASSAAASSSGALVDNTGTASTGTASTGTSSTGSGASSGSISTPAQAPAAASGHGHATTGGS
jgi:hypothetical protein